MHRMKAYNGVSGTITSLKAIRALSGINTPLKALREVSGIKADMKASLGLSGIKCGLKADNTVSGTMPIVKAIGDLSGTSAPLKAAELLSLRKKGGRPMEPTEFEPTPELNELETRIIEEAKNWTVTRDQCARAKITRSHQEKNGISPEALSGLDAGIAAWSKFVAHLGRRVERLVRTHPVYEWIDQITGLSGKQFAELLLLIGPLRKYPNPQKVYKRLGLHVVEGKALRKKKGQFLGYNTRCKGWAFVVGDLIVKSRGNSGPSPYRRHYDTKKAEYLARDPKGPSSCRFGHHHKDRDGKTVQCPPLGHVENAARRYAIKKLVRDLWLAYQARVGTGLDVRNELELKEKYGIVLDHKIGQSRNVPKEVEGGRDKGSADIPMLSEVRQGRRTRIEGGV